MTRSGRTKKLGSRTVGVGDKAWTKLGDESSGVREDNTVGELLGEDMPSEYGRLKNDRRTS